LIEQAINEYGPKSPSIIFEEQLKSKLGNFNEFKRPKKLKSNEKYAFEFINSYYYAIAARKLFESI